LASERPLSTAEWPFERLRVRVGEWQEMAECRPMQLTLIDPQQPIKHLEVVKSFHCARVILSGIEVVHMVRKGQMRGDKNRSVAEQFYSLVI
jgi:hypothetical protein